MVGEIGGAMEEDAAEYAATMNKPIAAYIAGQRLTARARRWDTPEPSSWVTAEPTLRSARHSRPLACGSLDTPSAVGPDTQGDAGLSRC